MRIDPHCPVEHMTSDFAKDDRGNVRAYLKLNNLSPSVIERLDALAVFEDEGGRRAEIPFSMEGLRVPPRTSFAANVSTDEAPWATKVSVQFTRVIFEGDKPVWMYSPARLVEVPDLPRPDGRELNRLRSLAGEDAVGFPRLAGALWICVCGLPNPYRRRKCRRCARERDVVFTAFDMARVLRSPAPNAPLPKVDMPLFEENEPQEETPPDVKREEALRLKFLRERGLLIRRTVTMLVAALILIAAVWAYKTATTKPESIAPVKIGNTETERG